MRFHDAIGGLFFFVLGLAVLLMARNFPEMPGQDIGPATFPTLIGIAMMVGGGAILVSSLRRTGAMAVLTLHPGWRHAPHAAGVAFFLLGALVFSIWFEQIGFPLGAFVLASGMYLLNGTRRPRVFLLAAAFVLAVALVMTRVLSVPLPMGSWL